MTSSQIKIQKNKIRHTLPRNDIENRHSRLGYCIFINRVATVDTFRRLQQDTMAQMMAVIVADWPDPGDVSTLFGLCYILKLSQLQYRPLVCPVTMLETAVPKVGLCRFLDN
ncbi:hypothetical protein PoB_003688800 [Plakobranchus ocellatus]|uniref:Uncharacterized protein n=1 Tax=Plakobranchus ocellatus TaxID=259542 RepID=A0AAV4AU91_9GAST|nr:hypothetical protein PoB_003688800 [Plakobranchus ocellatus]